MLKPDSSGKRRQKKQKIKWSKLYSFACFNPAVNVDDTEARPNQQLLGQPGFSRVVFCNEPHLHKIKPYKYPNNYVSTTKYNLLTFLPKALFEQFRRVANLYFLLAAALSVTSLSPFEPASLISPLVFVVGISMLKEAMEDWNRFLQDLDVNSRKVMVHSGNGSFVEKPWRELCVGNIVKVRKNEYFPSDLLLLSSSYGDGVCYVETMNLDGETNLKFKRSLEVTLGMDEDVEFSKFDATIHCEDPNPDLYTFVGNLEFQDGTYPLSPTQILLRDSKLRNTEFIYGVVIFTGPDAKAVRNSTKSPSKRSRIERRLDFVIYALFVLLVIISLINSIGSVLVLKFEAIKWWYLELKEGVDQSFDPSNVVRSFFCQLVRALILYGYLIPISLYVSVEVVKVLQAMFINKDLRMFDDLTGKAVVARTSNLNEELGQVEIILSDKTGTLTCNQMEFRKCSIEGTSYGGEINEVDLAASRRINIGEERHQLSDDASSDSSARSVEMFEFSMVETEAHSALHSNHARENSDAGNQRHFAAESIIKGFNFRDSRLMDRTWVNGSNVHDKLMFFRVMALCHTGIPVEEGNSNRLKYEAESPEEVAFLVAAQEFGFKFCERTQSVLVVEELDPSSGMEVKRDYKLLNLLEFNSSRKRMSVIVCNEDGDIFLFCKGADNVIFDRLADNGRTHQQATQAHLSSYAEDGLRTMLFAYRKIGVTEYDEWNKVFTKAKTTVGAEREGLLEQASEMIEKDLFLLGAVAIEDKLQKGVPECIDKLAQAGLKIWLLTGDKRETAVNVGFACSLLSDDMKQFHISLKVEADKNHQITAMEEDILSQVRTSYEEISGFNHHQDVPSALIVDGKVIEIALRNEIGRNQFLQLAVICDSVICCRVSPKQKALITRLVKEFTGKTTLAIGDGANDVGMIQEADIGVGISGVEGMQAVMASDFSMPQFRFLERLLIVHGHWCYKRIAKLILYFVYKNVAFGLTLFYYEAYSKFSGTDLYDDWHMVVFNVLLTSLPVIALGVLDKDISADVCLRFPALYQQGQKNTSFNWKCIIGWILNAILSSLAIFAMTIHILNLTAFREDGQVADNSHIGTIMYTCVIWTVNCQMALITRYFTWINHVLIWGSILGWYIYLALYNILPLAYSQSSYLILIEAIGNAPMYWIVTLLVVVVSLLPFFTYDVTRRHFFPIDDQVIREMKYCRQDIMDYPMWLGEQHKSRSRTQIGFSSRVDAKIQHLKEKLNQKTKFVSRFIGEQPTR
ncbi:OLC1v1015801C1 [Oldenlandia corymbosa var. corymbosa]|uniref:Phospholipid-transporting ATPase n=1 Tax=Oldenlandia corymbosa var. corymbosa TaxID=529605 RepID=A0AAV1E4J8_OLDCO|nr:OLC1v1015801C1 [Oldenlandia corymbosa var. corymbosa]